jgi:hypothetical protein
VTPYLYAGPREAVLWFAVAVLATAIVVWRIAPAAWRPRHAVTVVVACVTAYLAVAAGFESGFIDWIDHDVLERFRGGVDDIATWIVATAGAFAVLGAVNLLTARRRGR